MADVNVIIVAPHGEVREHYPYTDRTGRKHDGYFSAWDKNHPSGYVFETFDEALKWLIG